MRKPYCLCTKQSNKLERIFKHERSSKSVTVVGNIHLSPQFCGKAAVKRRITLSYKMSCADVILCCNESCFYNETFGIERYARHECSVRVENSVLRDHCFASLGTAS